MIYNAYALLDTKAGFFGPPFFCQTHGEAIRTCIDAAQDMRSTIARYPNDFTLFYIGQYDNSTGTMHQAQPENIGVVATMMPRQPQLPLETIVEPGSLNGAAAHG